MRRPLFGLVSLMALSAPAFAGPSIAVSPGMTAAQFRSFSEDMGAALSERVLAGAAPLGVAGFDIGVGGSTTAIQDGNSWEAATGETSARLALPTLYASKGLPFGIDIGGSYSAIPNSNIRLIGAEVSYCIYGGSPWLPALAIRGTYSRLSGVPQLQFNTRGVELAISKGIGPWTPFAGVGRIRVDSAPTVGGLAEQVFDENKVFVGSSISLGPVNLSIEADRIGNDDSISAKFGLRF